MPDIYFWSSLFPCPYVGIYLFFSLLRVPLLSLSKVCTLLALSSFIDITALTLDQMYCTTFRPVCDYVHQLMHHNEFHRAVFSASRKEQRELIQLGYIIFASHWSLNSFWRQARGACRGPSWNNDSWLLGEDEFLCCDPQPRGNFDDSPIMATPLSIVLLFPSR